MSPWEEHLFRQLNWYVAELCWWAKGVEEKLSANSDAIVAVTAELSAARDAITAKIAALEAAVAAGENLAQPLADLKAAADAVSALVPPVQTA